MSTFGKSAVASICVWVFFLFPGLARGEWLKLNLCLTQSMTKTEALVSEYTRTGGCPIGVQDTLKGAVRDQVVEGLLGLRMDASLLATVIEAFGKKARGAEAVEIRSQNEGGASNSAARRSFFLKASRKKIFLGFGVEW